jgi:hypothetical protein
MGLGRQPGRENFCSAIALIYPYGQTLRWNEYMKRVHAGKLNLACVRHRIKSHVHHLENTDRLECLFGWVDVEATTFFFPF